MKCKFLLQGGGKKSKSEILMFLVLSFAPFVNSVCKGATPVPAESVHCVTLDGTKGTSLLETKKWQDKLLDLLCSSSNATEAWGLFDQGGFAGAGNFGQVLVLSGLKESKVYYVQIRGEKFQSEHFLKNPKLEHFLKTVRTLSPSLKDHWDNGFDMFESEFVHMVKSGKEIKVAQRVKWRFGSAPCKEHCELEKIFHGLVK
jgi:hypothetical protein